MRSTKALISSGVAFILQLVSILSALIIPRMIIGHYGSAANGLIQSITQFLGYISLLQLGVGGVIRASLYKPLAYNDNYAISRVMKASTLFFRKVGLLSLGYVIILAFVFPILSKTEFSYSYIAWMVAIIGISTIVQYMVGFPARLLILADQRAYFYDFIQIIAMLCNIALSVVLIQIGCSLHIVKLVSSIVFILQPVALSLYVNRRYNINRNAQPDNQSIEQRWAGMSYSLADFVHRKTDIFVLTILSTLQEVSVYSVYTVVTNGIHSIIMMATNSFQAALGDMLAKNEHESTINTMNIYFFIVHLVSSIAFAVALVMIIPFVKLYTKGVADENYIRIGFSILILVAELIYCLRQPYQSIVLAAGKFRDTQKGAIIEACVNIIVSVLFVRKMGIVGVAIGTLIAMIYRTVDLVIYLNKNIIYYKLKAFAKRYIISMMSILLASGMIIVMLPEINSIFLWILWAIISTVVSIVICLLVNYIFFKKDMMAFINKFTSIIKKLVKKR